jgi:hypothetical protein
MLHQELARSRCCLSPSVHRFALLSASSSSMHASASFPLAAPSAGLCAQVAVHRAVPQFAIVADLLHAQQVLATWPPRRTSCRAVCAMNCVWRLSAAHSLAKLVVEASTNH